MRLTSTLQAKREAPLKVPCASYGDVSAFYQPEAGQKWLTYWKITQRGGNPFYKII
jgi:hypothetical protein